MSFFTCDICNLFETKTFSQLVYHQQNGCVGPSYHELSDRDSEAEPIEAQRRSEQRQVESMELDRRSDDEDLNDYVRSPLSDNDDMSVQQTEAVTEGTDLKISDVVYVINKSFQVAEPFVYQFREANYMSPMDKLAMKMYKKADECGVPRQFLRYVTRLINKDILQKLDPAQLDG